MSRFAFVSSFALVSLVGGTVAVVASIWFAPDASSTSDRVALATAVLTGATLLLAALAAVVALVAYELSARHPELRPLLVFEMPIAPNTFLTEPFVPAGGPWSAIVKGLRESRLELWIENTALASARNVAVRLEPVGLDAPRVVEGSWQVADQSNVGIHAIQWEGGGDYAVHGRWKHKIGFFSFEGSRVSGAQQGVRITIAADGFVGTTFIPFALTDHIPA